MNRFLWRAFNRVVSYENKLSETGIINETNRQWKDRVSDSRCDCYDFRKLHPTQVIVERINGNRLRSININFSLDTRQEVNYCCSLMDLFLHLLYSQYLCLWIVSWIPLFILVSLFRTCCVYVEIQRYTSIAAEEFSWSTIHSSCLKSK